MTDDKPSVSVSKTYYGDRADTVFSGTLYDINVGRDTALSLLSEETAREIRDALNRLLPEAKP